MVEKATTFRGVFAIPNSYRLLEHIINTVASDAFKHSMKVYTRDMTQFRKETTSMTSFLIIIPRRLNHLK